jgi:hypothetical protein
VTVHSLGQLGASNRPLGTSNAQATFNRPVNKLAVETDVVNAQIFGLDLIKSVQIGGSLLGDSSLAAREFGTIAVAHDIAGATPGSVQILAYGAEQSPGTGVDNAIGSVTVGGRVVFTEIRAGIFNGEFNADGSIGKITIGGDLIASSIMAGTTAGSDAIIGTADDGVFSGPMTRNSDALVATIGSIVVKGQVLGTPDSSSDSFGISAESIKKAMVGPVKYQLSPTVRSSDDFFFLAPTGPGPTGLQSDVVMLEVLA